MNYTSRSAIECYQKCPRRRYWEYLYKGRGIVQVYTNIPLTTGTCVHKGIESLLRMVQHGVIAEGTRLDNFVDGAVSTAIQEYMKLVASEGFAGVNTDAEQKFTLKQEVCKTEALVRAWAIVELPQILKYYDVLTVEQEVVLPLTSNIMFQAKIDAILRLKGQNECLPYSLKTMNRYDPKRTDRTFRLALQTITEAWAASEQLKLMAKAQNDFLYQAQKTLWSPKKFTNLSQWVKQNMPITGNERVIGTKHCFLIKGEKAKEDGEPGGFIASSPLVMGYKSPVEDGFAYAHSYYFPNPSNKSGKGRLGNDWQPFNVWEDMEIKEWIAMLASKVQDHTGQVVPEIQPECGDIIKQQVVTPEDTWIEKKRIEEKLVQIRQQEDGVFHQIGLIEDCKNDRMLDYYFPQTESACLYPTPCQFIPLCHGEDWKGDKVDPKAQSDPIGSGMYKWRMPHHEAEKESLSNVG